LEIRERKGIYILSDANFKFLISVSLIQMTHLKKILAGIRSCFSLTANERLIIIFILAIFVLGLGFRWWHLSHEQADEYKPASRHSENSPLP